MLLSHYLILSSFSFQVVFFFFLFLMLPLVTISISFFYSMKEESHVKVVRYGKDVRTSTRRALDEKLKEMKDQVIRARAYINFTPTNSSSHFVKELKLRVKELERAISQSTRDSRITRGYIIFPLSFFII